MSLANLALKSRICTITTFATAILTFTSFSVLAQDAGKGKELYQTCVQCHGENGQGIEEQQAPRIAGQFDWYILTQLKAFKAKDRVNEKMYPFIAKLSDKDFQDLAAYVSKMPVTKGN